MLDAYFYETFAEEKELLQKYLPLHLKVDFTPLTIQESVISDKSQVVKEIPSSTTLPLTAPTTYRAHHSTTPPAKIISIRTQSRVPEHWQSAIISRSTGFDHITEHSQKVPCGYLPHYCNQAVAEQAMVLWMNLLRRMPAQVKHFKTFHRDHLTGSEAAGKKVVVFGVGKIGYEICKLAKALQMEVSGVDIYHNYTDIPYLSPEEGVKNADIVVCAMNLFANNRNYFHYDFLKQARKGTLFVNISRGELSPTKDLLRLVQEEHLGGIALDVFENEDLIGEHLRSGKEEHEEVKTLLELQKHHNVILTPHNSFNTQEAVVRKCQQTAQQIVSFLEKGELVWKVPQ